ncbi:UDP-N-acetylmuramoyl-L-alanyl-D-glutamate--2,6-diaminopimelate ligase [Orbaceae bacterium ac157xtp]
MSQYNIKQLADYFAIDTTKLMENVQSVMASGVIQELRLDSRHVQENDLFIALKGLTKDGRNYIDSAIKSGAIAVLSESDDPSTNGTITLHSHNQYLVPQFNIYQLQDKLSAFANVFYDNPSAKMQVIGITGTNGKTTISQLIAQWATLLGIKSAMLGTIGNGLYNQLVPSNNTTSSAVEIQSFLASFLKQGVELVAMEVSSHGLVLGRVKDVAFSASLFTNLSRDHLDFHHDMQAYEQAKWSLFSPNHNELAVASSGKRIINFDDEVGKQWISRLNDSIVVSAIPENLAMIQRLSHQFVAVKSVSFHECGATILISSSWGEAEIESHLYGAFNVSNLLIAFATMLSIGCDFDKLVTTSNQLKPVSGRMEIFSANNKPTLIVDYAHTPDALEKALLAAKYHCKGKLWVIFGCGGDRDSGKRPIMASVAEKYADKVIVTNDNPRTEDPNQIIKDILAGFTNPTVVQVIKDRASAIKSAVEQSCNNDIIVIAGKGHEDYQILGKVKHHYSDREVAEQLMGLK